MADHAIVTIDVRIITIVVQIIVGLLVGSSSGRDDGFGHHCRLIGKKKHSKKIFFILRRYGPYLDADVKTIQWIITLPG
jgi:hypothetical protein